MTARAHRERLDDDAPNASDALATRSSGRRLELGGLANGRSRGRDDAPQGLFELGDSSLSLGHSALGFPGVGLVVIPQRGKGVSHATETPGHLRSCFFALHQPSRVDPVSEERLPEAKVRLAKHLHQGVQIIRVSRRLAHVPGPPHILL